MDLNKLTRGDQLIGISGIVLFIASFFNWFGYGGREAELAEALGVKGSASAWSFTLPLIAVLIGVAMVVYVVLKAAGVAMPALGGASWAQILLVAGGIAFLFVLLKLILGVDQEGGGDVDPKFGIFIGLIASAGLAAGAFLNFQEERAGGGGIARPGPGTGPTV